MLKIFSPDFSQRILIIALGGYLVSTIIITYTILHLVQTNTIQVQVKQQQDMSAILVRRLENTIIQRKLLLEQFASQLSDGDRLHPMKVIQKKIDSSNGLHHFYNGGLVVLDANAVAIADSPMVKGRRGINLSDRGHVKAVRKSSATVITRPRIGRGLKTPVFAINTPIKTKSGEILGFLLGVTRLADNNLFQKIGREFLGSHAHFFVIEPNLRLFITASNPKLAMQKLPPADENPIIDQVLAGATSGYIRDRNDQMILFSASKANLIPFLVIHTRPESELQASEKGVLVKISLIIIGFTLLIALLVWLLLRRQLFVLSDTSKQVEEMVEGKRPYQPLDVNNDDEIGKMITAFNLLQRKLSESITFLEQSNEDLEERVEHRTRDMKVAMLEAERASNAKSQFLSNMSHELRTPLNAILGFAQLLEMDKEDLDQSQEANVQEILVAGYHLLNLINEVLDLARIESGKIEIVLEDISVDLVLDETCKIINPLAEARGIEIIDNVYGKDYILKSDSTRLKQILVNILSNAVKYNNDNGRITIDAEVINNLRLRIYVTDTGDGISEKDINKLFVPFTRLNEINNVEGTGIGLVITKNLVELMGGTIGVQSKPGIGSTFWIELALATDEQDGSKFPE